MTSLLSQNLFDDAIKNLNLSPIEASDCAAEWCELENILGREREPLERRYMLECFLEQFLDVDDTSHWPKEQQTKFLDWLDEARPVRHTPERFMAMFKDDDLISQLTTDERRQIFLQILPGSSDITPELLKELGHDYGLTVKATVKE